MSRTIFKNIGILSVICIAVAAFALYLPLTCYGMEVDFSPNIINIESERLGEIRVFTDMRYSAFVAGGGSAFIYFNGAEDSVENIRSTRDSLGNLILKFNLADLLTLTEYLDVDDFNRVAGVVVMEDGVEYSGFDYEVYLANK